MKIRITDNAYQDLTEGEELEVNSFEEDYGYYVATTSDGRVCEIGECHCEPVGEWRNKTEIKEIAQDEIFSALSNMGYSEWITDDENLWLEVQKQRNRVLKFLGFDELKIG